MPSPRPQIDVLIATYNGARTWPAMLNALTKLKAPQRPVRYLVVDNGSTDETPALLAAAARGPLWIEVLREARPGKTVALRTGAQALAGDLVVFTDDDILPAPDWLLALESAADAHPEHGVFGGPIEPVPIEEPDPWYAAAQAFRDVLFAHTDAAEGEVDAAARIFGPNYMLRRAHVAGAIAAMQQLGPDRTNSFALGDETLALQGLCDQGVTAWFVAKACVGHQVRRSYTTLPYMLKRAQRSGRGVTFMRFHARRAGLPALGVALTCFAKAGAQALRAALMGPSGPDPRRFTALYFANWNLGAARAALQLARR